MFLHTHTHTQFTLVNIQNILNQSVGTGACTQINYRMLSLIALSVIMCKKPCSEISSTVQMRVTVISVSSHLFYFVYQT